MTRPPKNQTWENLMQMALQEAEKAALLQEIPVGALIVDKMGSILGSAGNMVESGYDASAHAEIVAIRQACDKMKSPRLYDCVLVTTLEPCLMCAACAAHANIAGIVYGASDPQAGAVTSRTDFLQLPLNARFPWHMGGILGKDCADILNKFFTRLRYG